MKIIFSAHMKLSNKLRIMHEKQVRPLDFLFVTFSAKVLAFVTFYLEPVCLLIIEEKRIVEGPEEEQTLFMHTRNGQLPQNRQIERIVKHFVQEVNPELSSITAMTPRGTHATWLLQEYRTRAVFVDKDEKELLEFVEKGMNTFVEQLRNTSSGIENEDYRNLARELVTAFETIQSVAAYEYESELSCH